MRYFPLLTGTPIRGKERCKVAIFAASVIVSLLRSQPTQALQFRFGFDPSFSAEMTNGVNIAGQRWSSILNDDVTVSLNILASPGGSALASFRPSRVNVSYGNFVTALRTDRFSPNDATAFTFLPKGRDFDLLLNPEFDLLINGTRNHPSGTAADLTPYIDADGDCNNRSIRLTTANARALGLPSGGTNSCAGNAQLAFNDGTLIFNPSLAWDFDPSDGISAGHYDFVGLATQGLGVVLGVGSGVDVLDFNTPLPTENGAFSFDDQVLSFVNPTDLFRFSADSLVLAPTSGSQSLIDWTTGRTDVQGREIDKYFSIDGGQTKIASFSTGRRFGDGYQASNWKADDLTGNYLGIFEPSPETGQELFLTENDRQLLDVIGWDLAQAFWPSAPPSGGNPPPSGGNPPPSNGNPPPSGGNPPPSNGNPPPSGGNPPPSGGNPPPFNPPPPSSGNPPPSGGGQPKPKVAVPEAGHGLGALVLVAIALGHWAWGRLRQ